MKKKLAAAVIVGGVMVAIWLFIGGRGRAQILHDPDSSYGIYQNEELVGEIMRVDDDPNEYVEHWVLYPEYVYGEELTIVPSQTYYGSLDGFFDRVPWAAGSRYVRTECFDGTSLP